MSDRQTDRQSFNRSLALVHILCNAQSRLFRHQYPPSIHPSPTSSPSSSSTLILSPVWNLIRLVEPSASHTCDSPRRRRQLPAFHPHHRPDPLIHSSITKGLGLHHFLQCSNYYNVLPGLLLSTTYSPSIRWPHMYLLHCTTPRVLESTFLLLLRYRQSRRRLLLSQLVCTHCIIYA